MNCFFSLTLLKVYCRYFAALLAHETSSLNLAFYGGWERFSSQVIKEQKYNSHSWKQTNASKLLQMEFSEISQDKIWRNTNYLNINTCISKLWFVKISRNFAFIWRKLSRKHSYRKIPSCSSSHWVSSLCRQLISSGASFVSFTLFSHCGLCLCLFVCC